MLDLSVIILSYNTRSITKDTILKLNDSLSKNSSLRPEIIVWDNASSDGSQEALQELATRVTVPYLVIPHGSNVGFPRGNNYAVRQARGEYVLFLNSDVLIENVDWTDLLEWMRNHKNTGALTVRVNLPSGRIDPASHRGFPTLWNSFCYYSKLEAITRRIPFLAKHFGGYHLTHLSLDAPHQVEAISGAFFLTSRQLFTALGGFDEDFFMYGEDIDLAYRMKEKGYVIQYDPRYCVTHLKYQSGLQGDKRTTQYKTKQYFYDAMRIFYRKHYARKHPSYVNWLTYAFINLKQVIS